MTFRPLALGALAAGSFLAGCALHPGDVAEIVHDPNAQPVVVATRAGAVGGVRTPQGQAFLGVPFAAPPVGPLRFHAPEPPPPWTGVRDATHAGASCIQASVPGANRQSEDCLTLNVYAPHDADAAHPRAVMVWLYGGGFAIGDNVTYDPSRLAERQGVVVVSPNYRLGAFGFLAHPALRGPGEGGYAVQDQQAALRWVRENITAFGGDPANVTVFGESAGGWSACYQLAAPGAAGLFQRAIIESGACTAPGSAISLADAETGASIMAAELGCGDPATAAACLRALPARKLQKAKARRFGILGTDSWSPAYGGDVLPLEPRAAFQAGRYAAVPVMIGTNRDEGRLFLVANRYKGKLWSFGSYRQILSDFFNDKTDAVIAQYKGETDRNLGIGYAEVVTDSTFSCPANTLEALLRPRAPVFTYEFDEPDAVFTLPRPPFTPPAKAFHSSEIAYVMQTRWAIADPAKFTAAQRALSDRMQSHWGAFARTGGPGAGWTADAGAGPLRMTPEGDRRAPDFAQTHRCGFWAPLGY